MGKTTGFMEYLRQSEQAETPAQRLLHFREFNVPLDDHTAIKEGTRCMDCGIPFCHNGCPVHNIIPDFNDLIYRNDWLQALNVLHSTNNFPEITGRICPAPCEAACTLAINREAVGIKSIERAIIDKGWANGWILPQLPIQKSHQQVAIIGSGPAGLACAQQLARLGYIVTVFEKNDRVGGLLRYGIPDFKLDKTLIDRRIEQMQAEGVQFRTSTIIGQTDKQIENGDQQSISAAEIVDHFDAIVVAAGAEVPRDLPVDGRDLDGIHFAMTYLSQQNQTNAGDHLNNAQTAKDKHVVVIGGGDTGSDCVGTANRQGAALVTQFELLPKPPTQIDPLLSWPYWPIKLRESSSHQEGCERDWSIATKRFNGQSGRVKSLSAVRVDWQSGRMQETEASEIEIKADLILLAMGFLSPLPTLINDFALTSDSRGNVAAEFDGRKAYQTNQTKVFAAGDVRRGQSLVVWAIREGRDCAAAVDRFLRKSSEHSGNVK